MRPAHAIVLSLLFILAVVPTVFAAPDSGVPQWIYVKLDPAASELDMATEEAMMAMPSIEAVEPAVPDAIVQVDPEFASWRRVFVGENTDVASVLAGVAAMPGVLLAEPAPVREITIRPGSEHEVSDLPNDPLASFQWHLAAVNAFAAWDEVPSADGAVVAILDNGVDIDHPDLKSIIWKNTAEIGGQGGFDDDGNGFIDDTNGWDAYEQDGNPDAPNLDPGDSPGHGTHCSGIAAAVHDNDIGVAGLGRGAKIMAVRIGYGRQIFNTVEGLIYATVNNADVISMSFAGAAESALERDLVDFAVEQGIIVVAAAGNEYSNDLNYPAAYPSVIAVAATDLDNNIASFSNFGWWVQAAAPGVDIFSTFIDGYGYSSGTSMAAPLIAGLAALLKGSDSTINQAQFLARIQQGARPIPNAFSRNTPAGVIDAWRSVLPNRPVVALNDLYVDDSGDGRLTGGETGELVFKLELLGAPAENLSLKLFPMTQGFGNEYEITGQYTETNQAVGPFEVTFGIDVTDNSPIQSDHPAALIVNADGWQDTLSVRIPIDLPYVTVQGGNLIATVSDFGAIGYKDYVDNTAQPDGVRLEGDMMGQLFHGSVMVSDLVNVSDNAYGSNNNQFDFRVKSGSHFAQMAAPAGQEYWRCTYADAQSDHPVNVEVRQDVKSFVDGGNIVYVDYGVKLASGNMRDLYVGVFCDWDILSLNQNQVYYNSARRVSYMRGEGTDGEVRYAGIVALSDETVSGARAIDNSSYQYTDSEKIEYMSEGTFQAASSQQGDWAHLIAVELTNVGTASYKTASFAIVSAESETELLAYADEALEYNGAYEPPAAMNNGLPSSFALSNAWPNPFNAFTRVNLTLDAGADVELTVYDVLGRNVATLHSGNLTAGSHNFTWNGLSDERQPVATGVYIIKARSDNLHAQQKVVLVK